MLVHGPGEQTDIFPALYLHKNGCFHIFISLNILNRVVTYYLTACRPCLLIYWFNVKYLPLNVKLSHPLGQIFENCLFRTEIVVFEISFSGLLG